MAKRFRERNPVIIGAVGLAIIALLLWSAFNVSALPLIGGGDKYTAAFAEAGGLRPQDEVRIAGVKVGKVTAVELDGDHVKVTFQVDDAWIGDQSRAAIKIKTILGAKYLQLDPRGDKPLDPKTTIPLARTTSPYDVLTAFSDLTKLTGRIDTKQLAQALDTLSATFQNTPRQVKDSVAGLSKLSRTIASRDAQLSLLLQRTREASKTLADRNGEFTKLLADGNLLLLEVQNRRDIIHALLENTSALAIQVQGLVKDNKAQLKPTLQQLDAITTLLNKNQDNLNRTLTGLVPMLTVLTNAVGNGRWFDNYIQNLIVPFPVTPTIVPPGSGG